MLDSGEKMRDQSSASAEEDPPLIAGQKFLDCFTDYFKQVIVAETSEIDIVWENNLTFLAASFVETHRLFRSEGKPTQVLLAYHYTDHKNLDSIERNGLLSKPERDKLGVKCERFNGDSYGPGVYCCHDPLSTSWYGDTTIVLAILRGNTAPPGPNNGTENMPAPDTIVYGPPLDKKNHHSVLKTTGQVLPLVLIPKSFVLDKTELVHKFHAGLQAICDEHFNNGVPGTVHDEWFERVKVFNDNV